MSSTAQLRAQNLDACIKCSACTAQCPVAGVYPLFPGPKAAGPDAERFRLEGIQFPADSLHFCSNCKTCEITCPSGVAITSMIRGNLASAKANKQLRESRSERVRACLLGRAEYLGRMGSIWPGLVNFALSKRQLRLLMEKVIRLNAQAPLPEYRRKFKNRTVVLHLNNNSNNSGKHRRAVYFPGCYATYNDPVTAETVVKVLTHEGYKVVVPDFSCCGVPLAANAQFEKEHANARRNLSILQPYLEEGIPIITSCPSCGLALKEEYPQAGVPGADLIGSLTYDVFEFLGDLLEKGQLRLNFQQGISCDGISQSECDRSLGPRASAPSAIPRRYGYHAACHLLAQGIGNPAVRLLRLLPGIKVVDVDGGCCGMSGSYGLKAEKYNIGLEIGQPLFTKIREGVQRENFNAMLTDCGMCRMQIEQATGIPAIHPVRILASAYEITTQG